MPDYKHFTVERQADVVVVRLRTADPTNRDAETVAELREELLDLVTQEDPDRLVIDFAGAEKLPSAAATSLLSARSRLRREADMRLSGMNAQTAMAYRFLRLHETPFTCHATLSDAITSLL